MFLLDGKKSKLGTSSIVLRTTIGRDDMFERGGGQKKDPSFFPITPVYMRSGTMYSVYTEDKEGTSANKFPQHCVGRSVCGHFASFLFSHRSVCAYLDCMAEWRRRRKRCLVNCMGGGGGGGKTRLDRRPTMYSGGRRGGGVVIVPRGGGARLQCSTPKTRRDSLVFLKEISTPIRKLNLALLKTFVHRKSKTW